MTERDLIAAGFTPHGDGSLHTPARIALTPAGEFYRPDHRAADRRCAGLPHQQARAQNQQRGEAMTKRRRTVPEGYVDEAIIEKLESSFGLVCNECLPTGTEIINAAGRILTLGLHAHLTNGNPSATTPEIEARLHKFAKLHDLIESAFTQDDRDRLQ